MASITKSVLSILSGNFAPFPIKRA
jgi:hypothetical protein